MTRSDLPSHDHASASDVEMRGPTAEKPGPAGPGKPDPQESEPDEHEGGSQEDDEPADDGEDERSEDEQAGRKKRRPTVLIVVILILLLGALSGIYYYLANKDIEDTDDAFTDGRAIQVAPQVAGQVVSLDITDNQFVRKGDPLIHIDPRQFINTRDQQQGMLDTAKAQLSGQKLGAEVAGKNFPAALQAAQASLDAAKASLVQRQADFARQKSLPRQATTQQDVDSATSNLQNAQAQVLLNQARVVQAEPVQQQIGETEAQVRQLAGTGEQAQAQLNQANLNLSYTVVRAPRTAGSPVAMWRRATT